MSTRSQPNLTNPSLHSYIMRDRLVALLRIRGEMNDLDFKETVDLEGKRARAELSRDFLGFMNNEGGGHIIFGVRDNTFELVGLATNIQLDTTSIYQAVSFYIDGDVRCAAATYDLTAEEVGRGSWLGTRRFGILYVARRLGVARPRCDASFPNTSGEMQPILRISDVLVRRGAQTVLANAADVARLCGEQDRSESVDDMDSGSSSRLVTNLPAPEEIATHFIGRREELDHLQAWFRDPRTRLWLLAGDGGKGKSAIAYEFATSVRAEPPDDLVGVLWVSAKRRRFVEGATQAIQQPDFWDLSSLLDAIARGYGFDEYVELPLDEKQQQVRELLSQLPILLVADDIDSLEGAGDHAFMFLMSEVLQTPSKILLTSRDVKFGLNTVKTQVAGFTDADGANFVRSRVHLFGLDPNIFTPRVVRDILRVTDRSPLYIEDLLRLCAVLPITEALERWRERGGSAAREYALKRELDRLPNTGRQVVVAACLYDGPVSLVELQRITGLTESELVAGIEALQKLFLVSRPRLVEGIERYDVNVNTRTLVRDTQPREHPELVRKLTEAYRQVTGQGELRGNREIGSYIRQAISLQSLGRDDEAEQTIRAALIDYPDNADLIAQLGILALRYHPRNPTDARAHFKRAAQLNCRRESMYLAWAQLEEDEGEWQAAIEAINSGLGCVGQSMGLLYHAGYAHSRWGQQFLREFHMERAEKELIEAKNCLRRALKNPEELVDAEERRLNGRILRALVLNGEALCRVNKVYSEATRRWAQRWVAEHPELSQAHEVAQRIFAKYPVRQRPDGVPEHITTKDSV